jgi:hypothetical protein
MPGGQPLSDAARARLWRGALLVSAIAAVVPLWSARFLPFSDLPEQVAVIATLRHWFDPAWHAREVYTLALGKSQYVLYHVAGALLSVVTNDAELSDRLLLTAAGLSLPYALRTLLRALDRDERLALFGAPAFWSRPLVMGFAPYVASLPVVTLGLALAARQSRSPSPGRAVGLAVLAVALFYLHGDGYVLFAVGASALQLALGTSRRPLEVARHLWWLAPSAAMAAAWATYGSMGSGGAPLSDSASQVRYEPLGELARELPRWSFDVWKSHVDEWCAAALWVAYAVLALRRRPAAAGKTAGNETAGEERRVARAAAVPILCAALAYVALPYRIGAGVMLNVRLAVFLALFAPLLLEPARGKIAGACFAVVIAAGLVNAGYAAHEIRAAERADLGDIDRLLYRVPSGAHVLTLPFHSTSAYTHWAPWTFLGSYARARRGGVASFSFTELSHWPLHYRAGAAPPPKPLFWTFDACSFRNASDGAYYDYVLSRGNVDPFRDAPPGPRWRKIGESRDVALYAKVDGVTSPPWAVDDRGPCESRWSLERAALRR